MNLLNSPLTRRCERGYTLAETMVATCLLGTVVVFLYAAFSSGFAFVELARENLRATQIMMQKMETVRLYKWSQVTDPAYIKAEFKEWYDPSGVSAGNGGTLYTGSYSLTNAPVTGTYQNNMRTVTVTLSWTNSAKVVRTRQMQTLVARYGLQNYVPQ